jgi:uncharacterized membrane protein
MIFLEWAAVSLHIFSVIVWLGALCYQSAVLFPVMNAEGMSNSGLAGHLYRRFIPFIWLCLWSIGITGVIIVAHTTLKVYDQDSMVPVFPLIAKIVLFIAIIVISLRTRSAYYLHRKIIEKENDTSMNQEVEMYRRQIASLTRVNILFGITAVLVAVGMNR